MDEPRATNEAARQAHRVHILGTGPVRQRRAVEHRRSREPRAVGRQQGDRPARLTVAVQHGRAAAVAPAHLFDEATQRVQHVGESLAGTRLGIEHHEIDRMPRVQRHPHFRIALEAADTGTVAGARVDHDDRALGRVHAVLVPQIAGAGDAQQRVVRRSRETTRVEEGFVVEVE